MPLFAGRSIQYPVLGPKLCGGAASSDDGSQAVGQVRHGCVAEVAHRGAVLLEKHGFCLGDCGDGEVDLAGALLDDLHDLFHPCRSHASGGIEQIVDVPQWIIGWAEGGLSQVLDVGIRGGDLIGAPPQGERFLGCVQHREGDLGGRNIEFQCGAVVRDFHHAAHDLFRTARSEVLSDAHRYWEGHRRCRCDVRIRGCAHGDGNRWGRRGGGIRCGRASCEQHDHRDDDDAAQIHRFILGSVLDRVAKPMS